MSQGATELLTFGGHLEVMRRMLFRILGVLGAFSVIILCFKNQTFNLLLAPSRWDFATYRALGNLCGLVGLDYHPHEFHVKLINTELSGQFIAHITASLYLGLLLASPYIVYELFRFVSPALYASERKYSLYVVSAVYFLFIVGVAMSYYVIFPISFQFLGTYSVDSSVENQINLGSYISTFTTLTFLMGLVFQVPVLAFFLAKFGLIDSAALARYRRHAFIAICLVSAVITPPDLFTLVLVAVPVYLLYELSIQIIKPIKPND